MIDRANADKYVIMPRLSLYKPNKGTDYKFFDRIVSEQFTVGGTDVHIHKYLGPVNDPTSTDASQPAYATQSERNIQDLLFLENRDRKYDPDVYTLRGVHSVSDADFDLSQFGLFLANDTVFISFHYNDMIARIGRKIIAGDVFELPHLADYDPLDDDIPTALKRFYVVQESSRASEGYSATWYSHIWRAKCTPLVDSQEYKSLLKGIKEDEYSENSNPIGDILSNYNKHIANNDALIAQAELDVKLSGYDTSTFYVPPVENGTVPGIGAVGYMTGDGLAPNGVAVISATKFPSNSPINTYVLRTDYLPNRLFRYDGTRWVKVEDSVRTPLTPGNTSKTLKSGFVNDTHVNIINGDAINERQSLSNALSIKADN